MDRRERLHLGAIMTERKSNTAPSNGYVEPSPARRTRGRPKVEIDRDAVADVVADLFAEGGFDAVTIPTAAEKLEVSRATLYRTFPTKDDLMGVLFERSTRELTNDAIGVMESMCPVEQRLHALIGLQVNAAVRMRRYMSVFFGGAGLPPDVFERWRAWTREYESIWRDCVDEAMGAGVLQQSDPVITTRLLLGMCIWVSRWYRPSEGFSAEEVTESVLRLISGGPFPHALADEA